MVSHQTVVQQGLRRRLYCELEPAARLGPGLSRTNFIIVVLVLLSLVVFALETEPTLPAPVRRAIDVFNFAILALFALEYLFRFLLAGEDPRYRGLLGRVRHVFTPYALTDIVAFLPELLWLLFAPDHADERTITFLRVLRLARLFKIARYVPAFEVLGAALRRAGSQLLTTLAVAAVLVYVAAVLLYFIEGVGEGRAEFGSIPRALWWSVATLTTVGYGDVYPVTVLGRIAASVIAIIGIGVVALPAGVFASAFSDELRERELARLKADVAELEAAVEAIEPPAPSGQHSPA